MPVVGGPLQKLHLVGLTTDLRGLILSARKGAKTGGFVVPIDARLLAVIADTLTRRNGEEPDGDEVALAQETEAARPAPPRPESALNPREIQARLRAGRSVEEVAKEARVDAAWVERFAPPIEAEQGRVVDKAVELHYTKPRVGTSALPLAAAVRRNLVDRGVRLPDDEFRAAWTAYHLEDTRWAVRFRYRSRGRAQLAEWEVDLADGGLAARNRLGGQLAHASARRRSRTIAASPTTPPRPAAKPVRKRPLTAKKAAPRSTKSASAKKGATMKRAPARPRPRSTR